MRTVRALVAMAVLAAVIGWSSLAMAVTFDIDVSVGWQQAGSQCSVNPDTCLGFTGAGGFVGSFTTMNWDNNTDTQDSFLRIGALPDTTAFPTGTATGTITDDNSLVRSAQIQHENNVINDADNDLASVTLLTQLTIRDGATVVLGPLDFNPLVTFLETFNEDLAADCNQTSNSLGSACDDQFTFSDVAVFDIPFSYLGQDYILHVSSLHNPDGSFACEPGPGGGTQIACLTEEDAVNDRFVHLRLENVTQQVPVPAALLLLGMGLVSMSALPLIRKLRSA